jgi:hypothetical protein
MFSWLRTRREPKKPASFRPSLESLGERIVPANAHFVSGGTSSSVSATTGTLTVNFHESGLGANETVNITLSGDAHAVYQWFNHGGNKPQGEPFNVDQTFAVSGTFTSDQNGQIDGTLSVNPPSVDVFLATNHAANWIPVLSVSYTNVVVTDTTNGVSTLDAAGGPINLDQPQTTIFTV